MEEELEEGEDRNRVKQRTRAPQLFILLSTSNTHHLRCEHRHLSSDIHRLSKSTLPSASCSSELIFWCSLVLRPCVNQHGHKGSNNNNNNNNFTNNNTIEIQRDYIRLVRDRINVPVDNQHFTVPLNCNYNCLMHWSPIFRYLLL